MTADYLANGGDQKASVDKLTVAQGATGDAATVTLTEADGTKNVFKFNGMAQIDIVLGTASAGPKVTVGGCAQNSDIPEVFGDAGSGN